MKRKMLFSFLLLCAGLLQLTASGFAQNRKLNIKADNMTIKEVLKAVESQTDFTFSYNNAQVDVNKKVTGSYSNMLVTDILDQVLKKNGIAYEVRGQQIILTTEPVTKEAVPQPGIRVTGTASDNFGELMPGVMIVVRGTTTGTTTDVNGEFNLTVPSDTSVLQFSYIGYRMEEVVVGSRRIIAVTMQEAAVELSEVTIVAFGTQKKESVIAAITTVDTRDLKAPSSNLTTAFAGRIAGLISYQRSGEPGMDNADFFIRGVTTFGTGKVNPLILIDGVEMTTDDLARLTVDDIASFTIMKDANATALYGARGANGVILVATKEGREGKVKVQFRAEGSYSAPTSNIQIADPVTYMTLHNEAIVTRSPLGSRMYSSEKILNTEKGMDPLRYPANDWQDMLFNKHTFNQRYNLNVSGGGTVARYYIAGAYSRDNGIIKMDRRNNFNNNIRIDRYVLRSNINVNLTKTTEAIVRLHGAFDDYSGPLDDGVTLYKKAMNANPVLFQPYYEADYMNRGTKHILFGNSSNATGDNMNLNPYAEMVKGYKTRDRSNMLAQFELKQNLDFITKGLSVRGLFNVNRYSSLTLAQAYLPFFYELMASEDRDGYALYALNPTTGRETLDLTSTAKELTSSMYFEGAIQYGRTFAEKHSLSGLMVFTMRESLDGDPTDLQSSLPNRNLGLAGRFTYGYDSRYFVEVNFGYNGSERFARNERFGFFPSVGGGWVVSNESFMQGISSVLSKLKLKATYGLVGNDAIGNARDRFFYMANVNMNAGDRAYTLGYDWSHSLNGISISRYSDPNITWEVSKKTNLGLELNLYKSLELQVDLFKEKRSQILMARSDIPTTMGLQATPSSNIGRASGKGVDVSLDYSKNFSKDLWTVLRGNFTYAASKYELYEEPGFSDAPWRRRTGQKIAQQWGLVAERLFLDDAEVANSPTQFGNYSAGDIKYKDINGDGLIDDNDMVPIGYPTMPELQYGFGISAGIGSFDFSCFFQGSARSSFWVSANATAPFINDNNDAALRNFTTNRALLQYWADSHWTESDKNIFALWPRLSTSVITNNERRSTWFMRDGSFLRLKTAEMGYTLPQKWVTRAKIQNVRIYINGSNLLVWSVFKMWDPEMAGDGLGYPLQRVLNVGVNLDF